MSGGFGCFAGPWSLKLFMMVFQGCSKLLVPCHHNTYGREQNDVQACILPDLGSLV